MKFKDHYNQIGRKKNFKTKYKAEDKTDQSQLTSASIVEMAKRYGIDAIIAKAEQMNINDTMKDKLYGYDLTNMYKSKEDMLNVKKKLNNLFENIPARIRKEHFNDNPMEFINAYVTNNEEKLAALTRLGIVSETQLERVKSYNAQKKQIENEHKTRENFIRALENQQGALYENFKQTGNITINNNKDNTANNSNVQTNL